MNDSPDKIIARYKEFIDHKIKREDALYLVRLMFELNYHGFERYVSAYFHKIEKYHTKVTGGMNDKGIDIEGSKPLGHKELHLAVQCKKWYYQHQCIKKKEILEFDYNAKNRENYNKNPQLYFITTTNASKEAKKVAKERGIVMKDCRDLLKMKANYGLDDFKKDTSKRRNNERLFTKNNATKTIQDYLNEKSITHRIFRPIPH